MKELFQRYCQLMAKLQRHAKRSELDAYDRTWAEVLEVAAEIEQLGSGDAAGSAARSEEA